MNIVPLTYRAGYATGLVNENFRFSIRKQFLFTIELFYLHYRILVEELLKTMEETGY